MQDSEVTTTSTSNAEGRLKVDTGGMCSHGKKGKCLKCALAKNKKDGKGGRGYQGIQPAIRLHEVHMSKPKAVTLKSQTLLMNLLKKHKKEMDGQGGPGVKFPIGQGGYGATQAQKTVILAPSSLPLFAGKKQKSLSIPSGLKPKGIKAAKFSLPSTSALFKSMKIGKGSKIPKGMKSRSLKAILRGN